MFRTRLALAALVATGLAGIAVPADAGFEPLASECNVACCADPSMVLTAGHLHRWQLGLTEAPGPPC